MRGNVAQPQELPGLVTTVLLDGSHSLPQMHNGAPIKSDSSHTHPVSPHMKPKLSVRPLSSMACSDINSPSMRSSLSL